MFIWYYFACHRNGHQYEVLLVMKCRNLTDSLYLPLINSKGYIFSGFCGICPGKCPMKYFFQYLKEHSPRHHCYLENWHFWTGFHLTVICYVVSGRSPSETETDVKYVINHGNNSYWNNSYWILIWTAKVGRIIRKMSSSHKNKL